MYESLSEHICKQTSSHFYSCIIGYIIEAEHYVAKCYQSLTVSTLAAEG